MSRFVLHIGPHKTGTTYIQKHLFEKRDLLRREGVLYPSTGVNIQFGHHALVDEIIRSGDSPLLRKIVSESSEFDTTVLSSENFDRLDRDQVGRLHDILGKYAVRVIYYYRRFDDTLISSWQEEVRHGGCSSWEKYVLPHVVKPFASKIVNPDTVLKPYCDVFGDQITIVGYDQAIMDGEDILSILLKIIPCRVNIDINRRLINKSSGYDDIEIIRALNILWAKDHGTRPLTRMRSKYIAIKKDNPSVVTSLLKRISATLMPFSFSGSFIEKRVVRRFLTQYSSFFFNFRPDVWKHHEYLLPTDAWLHDKDALQELYSLYEMICVESEDEAAAQACHSNG